MRTLLVVVFVSFASAQDPRASSVIPSVHVHGESTVAAQPDQAEIDIGVITQGATSQAAADLNAKQAATVVGELQTILPPASIKIINFSINPNYRYPKDGGTPVVLGYTANNTVRCVLSDVSLLRKVIEAATKAGASNVNRLSFTLKDEKPVRAEALGKAAEQARAGAEALASSLKLKLGRVLLVEEGQPLIISPARQIDLGKAQSTDTSPISPGNIEVHANVNVTYELISL